MGQRWTAAVKDWRMAGGGWRKSIFRERVPAPDSTVSPGIVSNNSWKIAR